MTRDEFYRDKSVVRTEWWLDGSRLPEVVAWACLRVFDDFAADVRFQESQNVFAFKSEQYAKNFLGEDEYVCLTKLDSDDEIEHGFSLAATVAPTWRDEPGEFEYLGTY